MREKRFKAFYYAILFIFLFLGLQEQVRIAIDNVLLPIFSIDRHWALDVIVIIMAFVALWHWLKVVKGRKLISTIDAAVVLSLIVCYLYYRWDESVYVFTRWWHTPVAYLDVFAFVGGLYFCFWVVLAFVLKREYVGVDGKSLQGVLAPTQDAPIEKIDDDKFGMQEHVNKVVSYLSIVDVSKKAFSIGVVGNWGYGKSSFFNFIKDEIKGKEEFITMDFNPRSSKDIHSIQEDFLNGLKEVLKPFHPNLTRIFEDYAQALNISTNVSPVISFLLRIFSKHSKGWKESFDNIDATIKEVKKRIVVFVDDLDRLTAKELLEVLKVIDRNGSFSNVIFVSAYDKDYVNNALKAYLRHDVKCPYTDKYFDLEIKLPKHAFHLLMDYLQDLLKKACDVKQITLPKEKVKESIQDVEECLRKRLHTIRDVKRFTNQFLYNYSAVQTEVDFQDYFLLELIKFSHKEEYDKLRDAEYVNMYDREGSSVRIFYLSPFLYRPENNLEISSIDVLEKLFPVSEQDKFDSQLGRISNANSFDIYFYNNEYSHILQKDFDSLYTLSLKESCAKIDLWLSNEQSYSPQRADLVNYMVSRSFTSMGDINRLKIYFQLLTYLHSKSDAAGYWMKLKEFFQKAEAKQNITNYGFGDYLAYLNWMKDAVMEIFRVNSDVSIYFFPKMIESMQRNKTFEASLLYSCNELQVAAYAFLNEYLKQEWKPKNVLKLSAINDDDGCFYKPIMKCLRKVIEDFPERFYPIFMPVVINANSGDVNLKYVAYDSNFHLREVFPNPADFQNLLENHKTFNQNDLDVIQKFYRLYMRNSFHQLVLEASSNTIEEFIDEAYQKLLKLEKFNSEIKSVKSNWTKNKKLKRISVCLVSYESLKQSISRVDLNIRYKEILLKKIEIFSSHLLEERDKISGFSNKMVVGDFIKVKDNCLNSYQKQRVSDSDNNICKIKEILPDNQLKLDTYNGTIPTSAVEAIPIDGVTDCKLYYDPVIAASTMRTGVTIPVYKTDRTYYMEHFKRCYNHENKSLYDIVVEKEFEFVHDVQHWLRKEYHEDLKRDVLVIFRRRKVTKR